MDTGRVVVGSIALLLAGACATRGATPAPQVVAAFYPLEFVAAAVGGGDADVATLTPPGAEPHDLELSPGQARALAEADLIFFVGGGFQPALEDAISESGGRALDLLAEGEIPEADPHAWLDPTVLASYAEKVGLVLGESDPPNASAFQERARSLAGDLRALDREFARALTSCSSRIVVTGHAAFGYLAARYDLEQIGIAGIDPESEPSPQRLAEVALEVERRDVTTIFVEPVVGRRVGETIARGTGAEVAVLDPLESPPASGDYLTAMRANLNALVEGLGCRT